MCLKHSDNDDAVLILIHVYVREKSIYKLLIQIDTAIHSHIKKSKS